MRPMFEFIKETRKPFDGVEVGVAAGENAYEILPQFPTLKLHLVDSYDAAYLAYRKQAWEKLDFKDRLMWHCIDSCLAASRFRPGSMDFVYIDGDHSFVGVKKDIAAWLPIVRTGGVIGGHDINVREVRDAVYEAFPKFLISIKEMDWWVAFL